LVIEQEEATMSDEQQSGGSWREAFDKLMEFGLGAALLTKEAATKLVDDMVKRGSVTREDGKHLLQEMVEKGKVQRDRMDEVIVETFSRLLERSDIARRSQIETLEKRIAALEAELRARPEGPAPV
jgi:polyhydroxyalkanoate synthesis regulator phasin